MKTAERIILEILDRHGPQSFYLLDRRFVRQRAGGGAADSLSALIGKGFVSRSNAEYELTEAGREALSKDAA